MLPTCWHLRLFFRTGRTESANCRRSYLPTRISPDLNLQAKIPPTLIVHNEDDKTHVVGSKVYDAALTAAGLKHEFQLYPTGGHGYGLHCTGDAKAWPDDALGWLKKVVPSFGQ